jgi:8-oxo-dGTP diphosphatase
VLDVVAAVILHNGRYLACRRNRERSAGGLWEFPGGKIDAGETPEAALVREIREELGVTVRVLQHLTTDDTTVAGQVIRLMCFICELEDREPTESSDHDRLEWVNTGSLLEREWAQPDLPVVRHLARQTEGDSM